jgi:hypothetical protein
MENETNQQPIEEPQASPAMEVIEDSEAYGWRFHRTPLLIALGITILMYLAIFFAVNEYPPYYDPADLPPPPSAG